MAKQLPNLLSYFGKNTLLAKSPKNMTEINWKNICESYRKANALTYLNTASLGLVAHTQKQCLQEASEAMLQDFFGLRNKLIEDLPAIRAAVAQTIICPPESPEYLALVSNLSEAIHQVAQMLKPLQKVLLFKEDYPALNFPWQVLQYDITWLATEQALTLENIRDTLRQSGAKIIALSWVQYQTGFKIDLEGLAQICQDSGVLLVLDATQAWGAFGFEMAKYPSVIFAASAYKWATAGLGMGVLAMHPDILHRFPPPLLSTNQITAYQHYEDLSTVPLSMRVFELGHPNLLATLMLWHAAKNLHEIGISNIEERVIALSTSLWTLLEAQGIAVMPPTKHLSGIMSIPFTPKRFELLTEHRIAVTAREKLIRLSVHFYNHEDDLAHLASLLKKEF